jgi:hypothetical protein
MKTSQIEALSNKGNLASGAFNLKTTLRFEIVPEFYRRMGDVTWLRRNRKLDVIAPERQYNLPMDFRSMVSVGGCGAAELRYIGEDPLLVTAAELATTASRPHGYYIVHDDEGQWRAIKFDAIPDMNYTVPYVYRSRLVFHNDSDDVELNQYIPEDYQQALIQGLRREIMLDRFGQLDKRYEAAAAKFEEICEEAKQGAHDLATRNYAVYCD